MDTALKLTATLHRPEFQAMPTPQQAYLLLEAVPSESFPTGVSQAVNFCLVLDRSGSMAGEKLNHLKQAAHLVVDRLGAEDLLSIVIFDDIEPAELIWPASAVVDRQAIHQRIETIEERGGTHMSTGMRLGLAQLEKVKSPERVNGMILLTDGQTWEDEDACRTIADECRLAGVPIYVMGLGLGEQSNWDARLLEDLAQRSGGEWEAIEEIDQVEARFEKTLRSMKGTAATNAQLTMRLAQGVTPRFVWRVAPLISRLDQRAVSTHDVQVHLGDLQCGVGQSILADLLLPPRPEGVYRLVQADITYDVPAQKLTAQKVSIDVLVSFVPEAQHIERIDPRMMNLIERVVAHKLQTQALDEAAAGEVAKATQRLRAAATRLLELGAEDLASQANQQADQLEQQGRLDTAAAQKMRYATKRLTKTDFSD